LTMKTSPIIPKQSIYSMSMQWNFVQIGLPPIFLTPTSKGSRHLFQA
jgi:hypothetical protein